MKRGDRVVATEAVREISIGDTGEVVAGWLKANITVRWDKDGHLRRIHKRRLRPEGEA